MERESMRDQTVPAGPVDVTGVLAAERDLFVDLLAELEPADWDRPTECPAWSVQGIALHVLGDDLSLLSRQRDAAPSGLVHFAASHPGFTFRELLDGFNEQWVKASTFLSSTLLVELLRLSGWWTAEFYASVDPERLGEPVAFFGASERSPYWQIAAREYVERWSHHHQIRRALGRPALNETFLAPAAAAVARHFAVRLPHLGAEPGATITIALPPRGGWTLRRDHSTWLLFDGCGAAADVSIEINPALATSLLSRGLPYHDVVTHLRVAGDQESRHRRRRSDRDNGRTAKLHIARSADVAAAVGVERQLVTLAIGNTAAGCRTRGEVDASGVPGAVNALERRPWERRGIERIGQFVDRDHSPVSSSAKALDSRRGDSHANSRRSSQRSGGTRKTGAPRPLICAGGSSGHGALIAGMIRR
jgi:uncharacterized protein (TIGR03083 family)